VRSRQVYVVAFLLFLVGSGLVLYKAVALGFPLTPVSTTSVWEVELRLRFTAEGDPAKATLSIPQSGGAFAVIGENFVSGEYGLTTRDAERGRLAVWSIREADGEQTLYYRAAVQRLPVAARAADVPAPVVEPTDLDEARFAAAAALLEQSLRRSADVETLIPELLRNLDDPRNTHAGLLVGAGDRQPDRLDAAVTVLALDAIPARVVRGLRLERSLRKAPTRRWLEVWDHGSWRQFDPVTGHAGLGNDLLALSRGGSSVVRVQGGHDVNLGIAVRRSEQGAIEAATRGSLFLNPKLLSFSLFSLPIRIQEVYRILLLVPVAGFLLMLLRTLVGVKTFGTFMPVLIALAFRETRLVSGVVLFLSVVTLGLFVRFYFERLRLLLVPRLAAVLIVVVLLMLGLSVLSHRMGIESGLSVALFPMVILTGTIERMSVVWEERGAGEALEQGFGSLVVAICAYAVMNQPLVAHLVFVFPEILLVLLAVSLVLGRYTGYRLLELWRFRALAREAD
jgi:7 transmembrane helices usually fused to an inactive transglutaminase/Inactive transglutaminase fused to 7 transmembrane helices